MKKILKYFLLLMILVPLLGCSQGRFYNKVLKELESEYDIDFYLDKAYIVFTDDDIDGFDQSGEIYIVLDYSENKEIFLSQFTNDDCDYVVYSGRSKDFEIDIDYIVREFYYSPSFSEKYPIDWEKKYYYFRSKSRHSEMRLVYFDDLSLLYVFCLQMSGSHILHFYG